MLSAWLTTLKSGLAWGDTADRLAAGRARSAARAGWQRVWPYFHRHWSLALQGVISMSLGAFIGLAPPMISRHLVDGVILAGRLEAVLGAVAILAIVLAVEKILRLAEEFCFARFEQLAILDLQEDLIARTLRLPKTIFDDQQTGYLTRRLTGDVESLRFLFSGAPVNALGQALRLAGAAGFLFYLEWRLALLAVALLPMIAWALRFFAHRVYLLSRGRLELQAEAAGKIQESLADASTIKAFAAESGAGATIMSALRKVFRLTLEQSVVASLTSLFVQSVPGAGRALTLAAGAVLVIRGDWTLGSLLAFQAYLPCVFGPAQYLASVNLQWQQARAALERVDALFALTPEQDTPGAQPAAKLAGEVEFRSVSFAYPGAEPVLKGLCFHLRPGETLAVMGASGVGKTTLVSLLLRFYRPTEGEIYFDGRPAAAYELGSLRRRIGYLPQRPRMLDGTIIENLRRGNAQATLVQVEAAARSAGIYDEMMSLPHGFETAVGEGGLKLSEGQKQRLALASALVIDPDILILDEPTAALDDATENSVLDALHHWRDGRTIIVVSHRPSTARRCDRIIHLKPGGAVARSDASPHSCEPDSQALPN